MRLARDAGALEVLAVSANILGQAPALGGDFDAAARLIAEADAVTEATGTRVAPYGALVLAALRGREAEAAELIDATIEEAIAGGQGIAIQYAHWANAVVMNGLGRYERGARRGPAVAERRHAGELEPCRLGATRARSRPPAGPGRPRSRRRARPAAPADARGRHATGRAGIEARRARC